MTIIFKSNRVTYRPYNLPRLPVDHPRPDCVEYVAGESYFVGKVIKTWVQTDRVMSDVWEDCRYVAVQDEDGAFRSIPLGMCGENDDYTVDAPSALVAAYDAEAAAEKARIEDAKTAKYLEGLQEEARRRVLEVRKGSKVTVVRGRKVPKGTTGEVFWHGDSQYGLRVGIKDAEGTAHWTAESNVDLANKTELEAHVNGDWVSYEDTLNEAKAEAITRLNKRWPGKGDKVKTGGGWVGTVFWKAGDGTRVGVKTGHGREDVIWEDVANLQAVTA